MRVTSTSPHVVGTPPCLLPDGWATQVRSHSEVEPALAIDPRRPNRVATAYLQDRLTTGGGLGIGVSYSGDGGHGFSHTVPPNLSRCGRRDVPEDPYDDTAAQEAEVRFRSHQSTLAFDRDGTLYLATRSFAGRETNGVYPGRIRLTVSRSQDGGATWSQPVELSRQQHDNRPLIVADRERGGHVYASWSQQSANHDTPPPADCRAEDVCTTEPGDEAIWFARSDDGARTWKKRKVMDGQPLYVDGVEDGIVREFEAKSVTGLVQLDPDSFVMTMSGQSLSVFSPVAGTRGHVVHTYVRSDDGGDTWSAPQLIGAAKAWTVREVDRPPLPSGAADPAEDSDGRDVRSFPISSAAANSQGDVYAAWAQTTDSYRSRIVLRRYDAGSGAWGPVRTVAELPAQSFLVQVAVQEDGTVGVSWYDLADGDKPGDGEITTRARLAHSENGGETWQKRSVGPSFDLGDAVYLPPADGNRTQIFDPGLYVGDFMGLVPTRTGFALALTIPNAGGRDADGAPTGNGESDIWFARVQLP